MRCLLFHAWSEWSVVIFTLDVTAHRRCQRCGDQQTRRVVVRGQLNC